MSIALISYLDKCEANSGESNSKVEVSKVTDREMTPVKSDNSCKPANVNKLLKCNPTRTIHSWAVIKCKTWVAAERFSLPKLAVMAWHNFKTWKNEGKLKDRKAFKLQRVDTKLITGQRKLQTGKNQAS